MNDLPIYLSLMRFQEKTNSANTSVNANKTKQKTQAYTNSLIRIFPTGNKKLSKNTLMCERIYEKVPNTELSL